MWEINSSGQYISFLYSFILGNAMGFIYDVFRFDRALFKRSNFFVFIQDILFWLICAFAFFSFSVVFASGQIRGYLLVGLLLGFLFFRLTFSRLFLLLTSPIKKLVKIINKNYVKGIERLFLVINKVIKKSQNTFKKIFCIKKPKI